MAIRQMRINDDPILRKKAREITEISDRIRTLAADMLETMYKEDGAGLAGPQVGVLRRIVVIDVGDGPFTMINPVITSKEGEQIGYEGCLSFPNRAGKVARPQKVTAEYTDLDGNHQEITGEDLLARCICHECDHLDGIVFVDKIIPDTEVVTTKEDVDKE